MDYYLSSRVQKRFWSKVTKTDTCWFWNAYIEQNGYGRFGINSYTKFGAHVYAWSTKHGRFPLKGMQIMHSCANKHCCNPDHLSEGSVKENCIERQQRLGNYQRRYNCKIAPEELELMRKLYNDGWLQREIAVYFNTHQASISRYLRGGS